jgi:hypothetical protein
MELNALESPVSLAEGGYVAYRFVKDRPLFRALPNLRFAPLPVPLTLALILELWVNDEITARPVYQASPRKTFLMVANSILRSRPKDQ